MRILDPDMANWLLALPVAYACWFAYVRSKGRFRRLAAIGDSLGAKSRLSTSFRDRVALVAILLSLTALVVALMRPQLLLEHRTPQYEREDLVLILDRSVSMRATDIVPSRFTRAVREIKAFLMMKPEGIDRIGLVGFSGTSLILSYFTRDLDSINFYLDWIEQDNEPRFGTDIGQALQSARKIVEKDKEKTRKLFLLVSDGEDQGNQLSQELDILRQQKIRVFAIGVGSDSSVPIPVSSENGIVTYLEDEEQHRLMTRFAERTLQNVAGLTGARYFRSVSGKELAPALQTMARAERRVVGWKSSIEYRDLYPTALVIAAVAAVVVLLTL